MICPARAAACTRFAPLVQSATMTDNRAVRRLLAGGLFMLGLFGCAAAASAQTAGVRVGASASPDQFYFGAHFETAPLVDRLRFRPNVELGLGNDLTLTALNFEFAYHFPESRNGWHVYAGGGPALLFYKHPNDSESQGGFNVLLGVEHKDGLFFEIKAGAIDSPNFKIGIGYIFH
jgi:hypothetical protein